MTLFFACIWWIVSATEAGKEIRVLCLQFRPETGADSVRRTLATGEYLRHRTQADGPRSATLIDSYYDAGNSTCVVTIEEGRVLSSEYAEHYRVPTAGAWVAAVGMGLLSAFHLLLAAGAPWGKAAWGGRHERLPAALRVGSLVAGAVLPFGSVSVLQRAGAIEPLVREELAELTVEVLAVLFALSLLGNSASSSRLERRIGIPAAFVLGCACVGVAFAS